MNGKRVREIHKGTIANREAVEASKACGCFGCLQTFRSSDITRFRPERSGALVQGETAWCPKCDLDTIVPDTLLEGGENMDNVLTALHDYAWGG